MNRSPFKEHLVRKAHTLPSARGITIGHDVWIGHDVLILEGVHVGDGAVIAAKSVITEDVPDYAVVAGHPASVKRLRHSEDVIKRLKAMAWWNMDDQAIIDRLDILTSTGDALDQKLYAARG